MLVKDCTDKQVNLLSDLSSPEFYVATKGVYDKYPDHPFPTIGEDNWESFSYLISKGTYAGSLIKRLAKWMKKEKGFTPDPKFIGEIGNAIGKTQSKNMESYLVSISNWFDWTPGTFNRNQSGGSSETDSCFWKSRNCAREALRDIYDAKSVIIKNTNGNNIARCWLISASNDDFMNYDGRGSSEHDIIFNAYGNLELYKIARILTYCGYSSYDKITFCSTDSVRMYINNEMGFALSVSGVECADFLRIDPSYNYSECSRCDYTRLNSIVECPNCIGRFNQCNHCGCRIHEDDGQWIDEDIFVCDDCYRDNYAHCWNCGNSHLQEDMIQYKDRWYCGKCHARVFESCSMCGELHPENDMFSVDAGSLCEDCFHNNYVRCSRCRRAIKRTEIIEIFRLILRPVDNFSSLEYTQIEKQKEDYCLGCIESELIQVSDNIYIRSRDIKYIKHEIKHTRNPIIVYRGEKAFAFGLDFIIKDYGILDSDGDSVYEIMNTLIERFKELSLVDYDNAFKSVVKYSDFMEMV